MTTRRPARRSLAESFRPAATTPDRAANLEGLLPPRATEHEPPIAAPPESALVIVRDQSPARAQRRGVSVDGPAVNSGPGARERRVPDPAADTVRNVAVYLPLPLLERLRQTSRSRELTYADLLVEAAAAHLKDLTTATFVIATSPPAGSGMPARARRRRPDPGVQVQIRLDRRQVTWLDEQAERLGAPSRTALVVSLLRAHLGASK